MGAPHPLMTAAEVAAAFKISQLSVGRWRDAGELTAIIMPGGKGYRYLRAEVQAILAGQPLTPEQITALRATLLDGAL